MATHNLFFGGARTAQTFPPRMLPSVEVSPDSNMESDSRRGPIDFSITRRLVFKEGCGPEGCSVGGSAALAEYLENHTFANGDVLNTHILPRWSSLEAVWVNVNVPCVGLTFALSVRGNAASLGGTLAVPVPQALGPINAAVAGSQLITLAAPMYFDQNDMLRLTITAYPVAGLECLDMSLSPVVREYNRGFN